MKDKCVRCGMLFDDWLTYTNHARAATCRLVLKPIRTTNRTKQQIVENAERTWLKLYFQEPITEIHMSECRCTLCFQTALDKLVNYSDALTQKLEVEQYVMSH